MPHFENRPTSLVQGWKIKKFIDQVNRTLEEEEPHPAVGTWKNMVAAVEPLQETCTKQYIDMRAAFWERNISSLMDMYAERATIVSQSK